MVIAHVSGKVDKGLAETILPVRANDSSSFSFGTFIAVDSVQRSSRPSRRKSSTDEAVESATRSTTHLVRCLMDWTQQLCSSFTPNATFCEFCRTLEHVGIHVICVGEPCHNSLMFFKAFVVLAYQCDMSEGTCQGCGVRGEQCTSLSWPPMDVHPRSRNEEPCDPCRAEERDCVSFVNQANLVQDIVATDVEVAHPMQPIRVLSRHRPHSTLFLCFLCPIAFPDEQTWRSHVQTHACGVDSTCFHCLTPFRDTASLKNHSSMCDAHQRPTGLDSVEVIQDICKLDGELPDRLRHYQLETSPPSYPEWETSRPSKYRTLPPDSPNPARYALIIVVTRISSHNSTFDDQRVHDDCMTQIRTAFGPLDSNCTVERVFAVSKSWSMAVVVEIATIVRKYNNRRFRRMLLVVRGIDGWTTNLMGPLNLRASLPRKAQMDVVHFMPNKMQMDVKLPGIIPYITTARGTGRWLMVSLEDLARGVLCMEEPGLAVRALIDIWIVITHGKRPWFWRDAMKTQLPAVYKPFAGSFRNAISIDS